MNSERIVIITRFACLLFVLLATLVTDSSAQIYHVKEMNTEQLRALDREKTVVFLPGGILEQHGPYLPSYSDGYQNERLTKEHLSTWWLALGYYTLTILFAGFTLLYGFASLRPLG